MVAYKSFKTKEKSSWVIPEVVAVAYWSRRLRELYIAKFKSEFKRGFTKVVVTRAGRLREWSQGELRQYWRTDRRTYGQSSDNQNFTDR